MIRIDKVPESLLSGEKYQTSLIDKNKILNYSELAHIYISETDSYKQKLASQWEVLLLLSEKIAYVSLKNEEHEFINNSEQNVILMSITGHHNYSYNELKNILITWGYNTVYPINQFALVV